MNVLITGTTSGIGLEFAKLFAQKGYNLITVSLNEDKLTKQKEMLEKEYGIKVKVIPKDLRLENSAKEIYEEIKNENIEVDILINNAGFGCFGRYVELEWQEQKDLAMVNMISLIELCHLLGKDMLKRKKGKIVNIASIASFQSGPYMAMYYASKAFVRSFSEALSKEFEGTGVTVTVICPGPTNTNFEKKSKMVNSYMFTKLKIDTPQYVAQKSYKAIMKGKVVYVVGVHNKILTFLTRFGSLKLNRNIAGYINLGKNEKR